MGSQMLAAVTPDCAKRGEPDCGAPVPDSPLVRLVWTALEKGQIDPAVAIRELQAGLPGGSGAAVPFTRHPLPAVRREAAGALACQAGGSTLAFTLLGGFSLTRLILSSRPATRTFCSCLYTCFGMPSGKST